MRKLILSMVFVLGAGMMVNASSSVDKLILVDLVIEAAAGPASDCVQWAKAVTISYANNPGNTGDPNDYMSVYHSAYAFCYSQIQ